MFCDFLCIVSNSNRKFNSIDSESDDNNEAERCEHHELVNDKFLLVMKQLRQIGYLNEDDIQRYGLLD